MNAFGIAPFDAADYLTDDETVAAFLSEAFQTGEEDDILRALRTVARARWVGDVSETTRSERKRLLDALRPGGNPDFATILSVLLALGVRLRVGTQHGDAEAA